MTSIVSSQRQGSPSETGTVTDIDGNTWKFRHHSDTDSDLIRTVIPEAFGHRFRKTFGHFSVINRNLFSKVVGDTFGALFSLDYLLTFCNNVRRRMYQDAKETANVGN